MTKDNKETIIRLVVYKENMKQRLADPSVPVKHKGRESQYRDFLRREIAGTERTIEDLKIGG